MMNMNHRYSIGFAEALTKSSWSPGNHSAQTDSLNNQISIYTARNAVTGFQVHIRSPQDFVLTLDRANWLHPLGFTPRLRLETQFPVLPAQAVECFTIGWVRGDDQRWWMETLDRAGWAEVPAQRLQAVYVRLRIPPDLAPGQYVGQARAYTQYGFEDERLYWQGDIHLQVAHASLPNPQDWHSHLNLWQHCTSIARYHRVPLWSDAHFALLDRYYACLAQLGQKAVTLIAAEIPWSGQRCYRQQDYPSYLFEHAIIEKGDSYNSSTATWIACWPWLPNTAWTRRSISSACSTSGWMRSTALAK